MVANVNRKKSAPPFKAEDFVLFQEKPRRMSIEETRKHLELLASVYGGEVVSHG